MVEYDRVGRVDLPWKGLLLMTVTGTSTISTVNKTSSFDSNDDLRTACRNVCYCHQQLPFAGLHTPGRSYTTYLGQDFWIQRKAVPNL